MCDREGEILDSLRSGYLDAELRAHAASCAACADLLEVARALLEDRRTLIREAQLPGSGLVWWRTSMRARQEAARRAVRTARIVQAVLVTLAMIAGIALIGPKSAPLDFQTIVSSMSALTVPLLAIAALLILAPVAVYFVFSEE